MRVVSVRDNFDRFSVVDRRTNAIVEERSPVAGMGHAVPRFVERDPSSSAQPRSSEDANQPRSRQVDRVPTVAEPGTPFNDETGLACYAINVET